MNEQLVAAGMSRDFKALSQPEGTYPFALNAVNETTEGDHGALSTEKGTSALVSLPYQPIGSINLLDGTILYFMTDDTNSVIGTVNKYGVYTELVNASCLNFNSAYPIQGVFRIRQNCGRTIYFQDGLNPDKAIDIDDLDRYKVGGVFVCTLMQLNPEFIPPCVQFNEVLDNAGNGNTPVGAYSFAFSYLDKSENQTPWFFCTQPIAVIDDNYAGNPFTDLDGADPTTTLATQKALSFTLNSLDSRYEKVRIAVIYAGDATGTYTQAYLVDEIPVASTVNWTFRGFSDNDITITTEELVTPPVIYENSQALTQVENRLVRANMQEKNYDWAVFQRKALEIQATYTTKGFTATGGDFTVKSPGYYFTTRSHMRDEIVPTAIVFHLKNGRKSPPFHIPNRKANHKADGTALSTTLQYNNLHSRAHKASGQPWDEATKQPGLLDWPAADTAHLSGSGPFKYWQVYNTAIRDDANSSLDVADPDSYSVGELAYWESTELYPNILGCDGNPVFATYDSNGVLVEDFSGTPIRHLKMPDTTLEGFFKSKEDLVSTDDYIIPLGLRFDNIQYPPEYQDDIIGFEIVFADNPDDYTVLDKGILYPDIRHDHVDADFRTQSQLASDQPDFAVPPLAFGTSSFGAQVGVNLADRRYSYHGPRTKFNRSGLTTDHLKVETVFRATVNQISWDAAQNRSKNKLDYQFYHTPDVGSVYNRAITNKAFIDTNTILTNGVLDTVFANTFQQETYALDLEDSLTLPSNVTSKTDTSGLATSQDITGMPTDALAYYVSLKNYNPAAYGRLDQLVYRSSRSCLYTGNPATVNQHFGGDTFLTRLGFRKNWYGDQTPASPRCRSLHYFWCESRINAELRHSEDPTLPEHQYFPKHFKTDQQVADFLNIENSIFSYDIDETLIPNHYSYNQDYSISHPYKHFPLDDSYEYCQACKQHERRVVWSEVGTSEEEADSYKIFLTNNYKDIEGSTGAITALSLSADKLFIHTEEGFWNLLAKPQSMQSSAGTVTLGTGDFFSLPERALTSSRLNYNGTKSKLAISTHEYGTTFLNEEGRVFHMSDNLAEISAFGMRNWFEENMPLQLVQDFEQVMNTTYPFQELTYARGVGFQSTYDPRHKRLILHKRDYHIRNFRGVFNDKALDYNIYDVVWHEGDLYTVTSLNSPQTTANITLSDFNEVRAFENKSWTISYSFLSNKWVSFHSYQPAWMTSSPSTFLSVDRAGLTLWKHNTGNYTEYYGTKQDHIIELIFNPAPAQTKKFRNFSYISKASTYDSSNDEWFDELYTTFDYFMAFNEKQSTGKLPLLVHNEDNPYASVQSTDALVTRTDRNWKVSRLRDLRQHTLTAQPIFTRDWDDNNYQTAYPVDRVPNSNATSTSKNTYDWGTFRDKWLGVRLWFKPAANIKHTLDVIQTLADPSVR